MQNYYVYTKKIIFFKVPWINTGCERSSLCHPPSGMVNKRHIALRSEREVCCVSGTFRIRIRIRQKSVNQQKQPASTQLKWGTGSKIGGRGIEQLLPKIGESNIHLIYAPFAFSLCAHIYVVVVERRILKLISGKYSISPKTTKQMTAGYK